MRIQLLTLDDDLHPVSEFPYVASLSIDRGATGDSPMLESMTVEFDRERLDFDPCWVRVDSYGDRHDMLGCFWIEAERGKVDNGIVTYSGKGYSVLMQASDENVDSGSYCIAGSNASKKVAELLSGCPGETIVNGNCIMPSTVVFGKNTSKLKAAWLILDVIGWRIRLGGDGTKYIEPIPSDTSLTITEDSYVEPGFTISSNMSYSREYEGDVRPLDLIEFNIPSRGIDVTKKVISQRIELNNGLYVSETVGDGR